MNIHIHYATVFSDTVNQHIKGNAAAVIICDKLLENRQLGPGNANYDLSSDALKLKLSQQLLSSKHFNNLSPPSVICFIDRVDGNKSKTECFSAHGKIQLCGHGTLAANAVYQNQFNTQAPEAFNPAAPNHYQNDGQLHWLKLARIEIKETAVPRWATATFSTPPAYAAIAGDNRDYLILEWPSDAPKLQTLSVDCDAIKTHTQRAIIATQWFDKKKQSDESLLQYDCVNQSDFIQRYFAPQYGNNEDSATGSAHRVLCSYWHNKTGQSQFNALQCSKAGGILHSHLYTDLHNRKENDCIWIGGQVQIGDIIEISL